MDENKNQIPQEEMPEETTEETTQQPEKEEYKPRPTWQIWAARIGLVLFIAYVIMYYINIMRGGR